MARHCQWSIGPKGFDPWDIHCPPAFTAAPRRLTRESTYEERCRPTQHRATRFGCLNAEGAVRLSGAVTHIHQTVTFGALGDPAAVILDLDGEVIVDRDRDVELTGVRVLHGVADRLAHNGFGVAG